MKKLTGHPYGYKNALLMAGVPPLLAEGAYQALWWYQAAKRQRSRVLRGGGTSPPKGIDAHFYAVSLIHIVKASELVRDEMRSKEIAAALRSFKKQVSHFQTIRDVLEHWEEYARGQGRVQRKKIVPTPLSWSHSWTVDPKTRRKNFELALGSQLALDFNTSFGAARNLLYHVLEEVERTKGSVNPPKPVDPGVP